MRGLLPTPAKPLTAAPLLIDSSPLEKMLTWQQPELYRRRWFHLVGQRLSQLNLGFSHHSEREKEASVLRGGEEVRATVVDLDL